MLKKNTKQCDRINSQVDTLKGLSDQCHIHEKQNHSLEKLFKLGDKDGVFEKLAQKIVTYEEKLHTMFSKNMQQ